MSAILISIIIPVYNTELFLKNCLDSILNQGFSIHEYEVICVNDGSTDNSLSILKEYAEKYPELKIIDKKNGGVSSARLAGFLESKGEYAWFIDSDDFVSEFSLRLIKEAIINNSKPDRINFLYSEFLWDGIHEKSNIISHATDCKIVHNESALWNSVCKKELIDRYSINDIMRLNISYAEDTLFILNFRAYEKKCIYINNSLLYYRIHPSSATNRKTLSKRIKCANDYIIVASYLKKMLDHYELNKYHCEKSFIAFAFMFRVWIAMESIACLPLIPRIKTLKNANKEQIFPIRIPASYVVSKKDTINWSYGHSRFEKYLNCHSNTFIGFLLMCIYYCPIRVKTTLKEILLKMKQ